MTPSQSEDSSHVQRKAPFVLLASHACMFTTPCFGCICHLASFTFCLVCRACARVVVLVWTQSCHWLFSEAQCCTCLQVVVSVHVQVGVCACTLADMCTGLSFCTSFMSIDLYSVQAVWFSAALPRYTSYSCTQIHKLLLYCVNCLHTFLHQALFNFTLALTDKALIMMLQGWFWTCASSAVNLGTACNHMASSVTYPFPEKRKNTQGKWEMDGGCIQFLWWDACHIVLRWTVPDWWCLWISRVAFSLSR